MTYPLMEVLAQEVKAIAVIPRTFVAPCPPLIGLCGIAAWRRYGALNDEWGDTAVDGKRIWLNTHSPQSILVNTFITPLT
jgi:hypothetical protein